MTFFFFFLSPDLEGFLPFPATSLSELLIYFPLFMAILSYQVSQSLCKTQGFYQLTDELNITL